VVVRNDMKDGLNQMTAVFEQAVHMPPDRDSDNRTNFERLLQKHNDGFDLAQKIQLLQANSNTVDIYLGLQGEGDNKLCRGYLQTILEQVARASV
jgi:hypothetical protein